MDIRIYNGPEGIGNYIMSYSLLSGEQGYLIHSDFFMSKEFKESFIDTLLKEDKDILRNIILENDGFDISTPQGINNILEQIGDINFIKTWSNDLDGVIKYVDLYDGDTNDDTEKSNLRFLFV